MRCAWVTVLSVAASVSLAAGISHAGPWPRGAGNAFVSFQISAEEAPSDVIAGLWEPETFASLYGEVGLGARLTLGADIGFGETSRQGVLFLRYTLSNPEATWQIAVDAGLGGRALEGAETAPLVRLGASLGRGVAPGQGDQWYMPIAHDGGWMTLDGQVLYNLTTEETIWQIEGTAGLRLSDRWSAMLQAKVEDWPGAEPLVSVAPSVVYSLSDTTSLQLGARGALSGGDSLGLSLSIWQEF